MYVKPKVQVTRLGESEWWGPLRKASETESGGGATGTPARARVKPCAENGSDPGQVHGRACLFAVGFTFSKTFIDFISPIVEP